MKRESTTKAVYIFNDNMILFPPGSVFSLPLGHTSNFQPLCFSWSKISADKFMACCHHTCQSVMSSQSAFGLTLNCASFYPISLELWWQTYIWHLSAFFRFYAKMSIIKWEAPHILEWQEMWWVLTFTLEMQIPNIEPFEKISVPMQRYCVSKLQRRSEL